MWRHLALLAVLAAPLLALASSPTPASEPRKLPDIPLSGRVSAVEVHETVDPGLAAFIQRVLEQHHEGEIVLLDVNTLGGRLDSALAIRDALLEARPLTLCWVHPRAISAGALITLACDVVAVAPGASMGAATPVQVGPGGLLQPVEEKVASYMRREMANTARLQGRPPLVAEAMVDADVEIAGLIEKGKLLTLDGAQALAWGVADLEAASEAELWKKLGRDAPRIERLKPTGADQVARLLSDSNVGMVLMMLGLLGVAVELLHPSGGAALLFGLSCLGLFFFGHHLVSLSGWLELALVAAGLALVALEYFAPGHTVSGAVGFQLIIAGLFMALINFDHLPLGIAWEAGLITRALVSVFGALLATGLAVFGLFRLLPRTRLGGAMVLQAVISTPEPQVQGISLEALVGQSGVALTDLRPIGKIEVINKRVEARVERGFVSAGAAVRVVRVEGRLAIVREQAPAPREAV